MCVSVVNLSLSRDFWVPEDGVRQWIMQLGDLLCSPT